MTSPDELALTEAERPRRFDGLRTYERIDADGERYYDGVAAERDLKALFAEVITDRSPDVDEILDLDPTDPLTILAAVLASDWLAGIVAARVQTAREAELRAAAKDIAAEWGGHFSPAPWLRARADRVAGGEA